MERAWLDPALGPDADAEVVLVLIGSSVVVAGNKNRL
jgi:hypothetical protein